MTAPYTTEQLHFVKANCTMTKHELAEAFNAKFGSDRSAAALASLRKKHGWKTGRTGRFEKGHIPSPNARPAGPNATSFKKGSKPHNWMPIGTERVNGDGYIDIKVAEPNVWVYKQRLVWEQHFGPIPDGMVVIFKDANNRNFSPDNLELLHRDELLTANRNHFSALPDELKLPMLQVSRLEAATFRRSREGDTI
jgi:hypothetical protein